MKLIVISPEHDDPRETGVLGELFATGLERYHVRKPSASRDALAAWLGALPREARARIVVHQHHELVASLDLGGRHWRDDGTAPSVLADHGKLTSRSCHDVVTLRAALGRYDAVFFGPVFPSLSKPGHGPRERSSFSDLSALLADRTVIERRTSVLAVGGITIDTSLRALALGFDGVAVLGAIWQAADPAREFAELQKSLVYHAA
jgi:thiamine-phosphate pyrophosphorylase